MGKKVALLMGLNYKSFGRNWELYGCINDMNMTKNMLIDAYGYKEEDMYIFRDDFIIDKSYPTKKNITDVLKLLCNSLGEDDELWVHYSGHGSYYNDYGVKETDNQDELIIVYDDNNIRKLVALIDDDFNAILKTSKCKIIMVFDSCNSGTIGDLPWNIKYDSTRNNKHLLKRSPENDHIFDNKRINIFSSARDDEVAADAFNNDMQVPMGALTMAILNCLRKSNHNTSCIKLYSDICQYMKRNNFAQRPQLSCSTKYTNEIITRDADIEFIENDVIIEELEIIRAPNIVLVIEDVVVIENDNVKSLNKASEANINPITEVKNTPIKSVIVQKRFKMQF